MMEDALLLTQIVNCTKKSMYMTVQKNCFHVKKKKPKLLIPYCCVEKKRNNLLLRLSNYFCNKIVNKRNK